LCEHNFFFFFLLFNPLCVAARADKRQARHCLVIEPLILLGPLAQLQSGEAELEKKEQRIVTQLIALFDRVPFVTCLIVIGVSLFACCSCLPLPFQFIGLLSVICSNACAFCHCSCCSFRLQGHEISLSNY
jgi:hypothetical protein